MISLSVLQRIVFGYNYTVHPNFKDDVIKAWNDLDICSVMEIPKAIFSPNYTESNSCYYYFKYTHTFFKVRVKAYRVKT